MTLHVAVGQLVSGEFDRIIDIEVMEDYNSLAIQVRVRGMLRSGARGIHFRQPTEGDIRLFLDSMKWAEIVQAAKR